MNTRYYYNPIDCACKSVVGGIKAGEEMQINLFYLKAEESVEKLLELALADKDAASEEVMQGYFQAVVEFFSENGVETKLVKQLI